MSERLVAAKSSARQGRLLPPTERQWWVRGNGRWAWLTIGAELVVVWAAVLTVMVGVGLLVTGPLESVVGPTDNHIERWFESHRTPRLTSLAEIGGTGGDTITIAAMAVCVGVAVSWWQHSPRPAVFLLVGLAGQALIYYTAANVVHRPRPPVEPLDYGLDPNRSFPSGHVSTSIMFCGGCLVLVWLYAGRRWRLLALLMAVVPFVVAVSRLYQGVHHPTDTLASLLVVPFWVAVMAVLVLTSRVEPRRSVPDFTSSRGAPSGLRSADSGKGRAT